MEGRINSSQIGIEGIGFEHCKGESGAASLSVFTCLLPAVAVFGGGDVARANVSRNSWWAFAMSQEILEHRVTVRRRDISSIQHSFSSRGVASVTKFSNKGWLHGRGVCALGVFEFVGIDDGVFNSSLGCVVGHLAVRVLGCDHGNSGSFQLPSDGAGNGALPALLLHPEVAIALFGGQ